MEEIGYDHLPMYVAYYEASKPDGPSGQQLDEGDLKEAGDTMQRAKDGDEK